MFVCVKREGDSQDQPLAGDGRQLNLLTHSTLFASWLWQDMPFVINTMIPNVHLHWQN
jgi:hypothetical protein